MPPQELRTKIFDVVNQLNAGRGLLSAAYAAALNYLTVGLICSDFMLGGRKYELAFGLWYERAEAELLNGNFKGAERLILVLLQKAHIESRQGRRLPIDNCTAPGERRASPGGGSRFGVPTAFWD
jgi:predicted ATPase